MIKYTIASEYPSSHIFNVSLTFELLKSEAQQLIMPCWIPGSYTIRDFARHVVQLKLSDHCAKYYQINKINSYTWQLDKIEGVENPPLGPITVEYEVYAWDRSVRGCHLDTTHAFINLSCLTLMVVGQEASEHQVHIGLPKLSETVNWTVATTLTPQEVNAAGFGWYSAQDYAELIDHPVEMGIIERVKFSVNNIPHEIAISGQHYGDVECLKNDVQKVVEAHHRLFNNHLSMQAPFSQYCFLLTLLGEGYGGLEHRSSTALISTRSSMPAFGISDTPRVYSKEYKELLGLFSHEYFHAWNVKRIKPSVFCPYDLTQPQYTRQLWAFEGITAYYDELALIRAGVINLQEYLQMLSDKITKLKSTLGHLKQSVADSSFDAWIKFYKPDENSSNSRVSYYTKGMLAALCFDMMLRHLTHDEVSLDDIMRSLWARYQEGIEGVLEGEIDQLLYEKSDRSPLMAQWVEKALYTTEDLPLEEALAFAGLTLDFDSNIESASVTLGITVGMVAQELVILTVFDRSAAMNGGLSAKDVLVAIDSLKINNPVMLEKALMNYQPGDVISVHVFREDRLLHFKVKLLPAVKNKAVILMDDKASEGCISRRTQWLTGSA